MESELLADKEKEIPPVPIKTYQWEDLRREREAGRYPWTYLLKAPLEGEITAEDIIRETTPRRSMSREVSRSRTHSPVDGEIQRILNLDSSPGSSRKHGEEGEDEGVHIPNFSKEISLESEDDPINQPTNTYSVRPESRTSAHLMSPVETPKNISPKSILKRRAPDPQYVAVSETREKTKCCHPLVNKIKHLADKTLHKLDRNDIEKSPLSKRKKNEETQEIRQLKSSPGAVRRQKFSAIKLGDSDEMSKTMSIDTPPPRKKKEHIYEDIEESKYNETTCFLSPDMTKIETDIMKTNNKTESDSLSEKKSITSQDPSLVAEESYTLKQDEHVMEKLHKKQSVNKEALLLDDDMDVEEPNVDEIFQEQLEGKRPASDSPNITITEITDDSPDNHLEQLHAIPIESSPSPAPRELPEKQNDVDNANNEWSKTSSLFRRAVMSKLRRWTSEGGTPIEKVVRPTRESSVQLYTPEVRCACQFFQCDSLLPERVNPVGTRPTSRASNIISNVSDHEYEIIEKPPPNIIYTAPSIDKPTMVKTDDELSSTTSLERKYLQHTSDEDDQVEDKENDDKNEEILSAEDLQKNIEERFFVNTPSTPSRTECEISTSQVDSSALEKLPLQRSNRSKNNENMDKKIQQRIKEGTGKLKSQAGKLKSKLQNMKSKQFTIPDRPKFNFPERPKFRMPDKPKLNLPERTKFTLPDRRKFSLPERTKFKNINFQEKFNMGDRKKFTFLQKPKFNVPDLSKLKMPERPKINFPSLGRKKEYKLDTDVTESSSDVQNIATVEFEAKTYPRFFNRKKRSELPKTSSSPTLNRDDTPPPTFTFTRVKKSNEEPSAYIPDSPEQPREYGNIENDNSYESQKEGRKQFDTTYDFDKLSPEYMDDDFVPSTFNEQRNATSISDMSLSKQEYTHINEINTDEFFVRPRGISRENIQMREYLSDEIRQAFNIPKNVLATMGSNSEICVEHMYANDTDAVPELTVNENETLGYSTENLNDKDDGYYTFPPVRPSRAKRKKKETESIKYIDESVNASMQFSEVDLGLCADHIEEQLMDYNVLDDHLENTDYRPEFSPSADLRSIHEYTNDDVIEYPDSLPVQSQTLPMPPRRKKKNVKKDLMHSSLNDFKTDMWEGCEDDPDNIIVYRTEHEYIVPQIEPTITERSPVAPHRNRSRSSRGTSLCDDDRTSQGAESLTLDTHLPLVDVEMERESRQESPGYATIDKGPYPPPKGVMQSENKIPPARRRKSNSSERKYYTVGPSKAPIPDRPPRKKSSTSLMTLNSFTKGSIGGDLTQYVEIDELQHEDMHNDLISGEIVSKMKDRPLPPPPRPPRGPKRKKKCDEYITDQIAHSQTELLSPYNSEAIKTDDVVEIEVSTQTDPLPDDIDFELGMDENLDLSMSSSLRDIIDEDSMIGRVRGKALESPHVSRTTSRSEKSLKLSDPKMCDYSKSQIDRSSPTVILVEKRVSSPTRINEREEMLTEASLTIQHVDVDQSKIPDVPPLPKSKSSNASENIKQIVTVSEECNLEVSTDACKDVHLDNLVTQRLQVKDLDVGRLNVSELQASKILVSDIEGMTLQVSELDSKSGHITVSGIELSQSVIDEIVKKFAEISTTHVPPSSIAVKDIPRPVSREEHTQTEEMQTKNEQDDVATETSAAVDKPENNQPAPPPRTITVDDSIVPPQRPPPPDLTPLLYNYLQELTLPSSTLHPRSFRERPISDFHESQHHSPPPPVRRAKRKPAVPQSSHSSSDDDRPRPSSRQISSPAKPQELSISETGAQFLRACHNSIIRIFRNIFNSFMSYVSGADEKKDVQMALVIFLVLIAGLIMFGLSDSRTVHHHHWEFFNPPDGNQ